MNAMERLYKQFPADDEVKTFYALSLLSGARALDDNTFRYEVKAGALALDVFHRNPKHPGAPHYTIHSFDDPVHAPLSLDAAKAYAAIVPAVSHGVHMPTHIFIQHGMWNEVSSQNMRAFQVAKDLWQPGTCPATWCIRWTGGSTGSSSWATTPMRARRSSCSTRWSRPPSTSAREAPRRCRRPATSSRPRSGRCSRSRRAPPTRRCWPMG